MANWQVGASTGLSTSNDTSWDGGAASAAVFAWAGGDDFDPSKAKRAFLAYDAANPKLRGSYKLPIARPVNGHLVVPKGAVRAAASRLPGTQIPSDVKARAHNVIAAYEAKLGMGKSTKMADGDC